jgi:hypothetical protein
LQVFFLTKKDLGFKITQAKEDNLDKIGTIRLVSSELDCAVAADENNDLWFILKSRRAKIQLVDTDDGPVFKTVITPTLPLPVQDEKIRFAVDAGNPIAKVWFSESDYEAYQVAHRTRWQQLANDPRIRIVRQTFKYKNPSGDAKTVFTDHLSVLNQKYPIRKFGPDKFANTTSFDQHYEYTFYKLTPTGWVKLDSDPRARK